KKLLASRSVASARRNRSTTASCPKIPCQAMRLIRKNEEAKSLQDNHVENRARTRMLSKPPTIHYPAAMSSATGTPIAARFRWSAGCWQFSSSIVFTNTQFEPQGGGDGQ